MARDSVRCSFCGKRAEQVSRIIAGPNVYICNECVDLCSSILADEMHPGGKTSELELPDTLPTPQEIKTYMDRYIIGQDEAKVALSVAVLTNLIPQIIKAGEKIGTVILEDGKEEPIIAEEDITIEAGTPVAVKMYARRGIIDERTPLFR